MKNGENDTVERMLAADPALAAARDENGLSAIVLAHYYGKADVVKTLLARTPTLDIFEATTAGDTARVAEILGADAALANAWSKDGFFPLGLAAFFKRPAIAKLLLAAGADPRMASKPAGFTPLHSAVADDSSSTDIDDLVKMLLDAAADPNAKSASGGTPLHTAGFTGNVTVVRMLLGAGADPNATDGKGYTPLDHAREKGHSEAAALLHDAVMGRRP
ncbi:MAG: ankyrin repeat domain-containing protein [Chloroflexota bacterium]|nr:ankyrin repeat domain-containing protein [Chloroflexota bacterium]